MASFYVDYSGPAGTGDGSSFANRAGKIEDSHNSAPSASDDIRIKGNPITSMGTCKITHRDRPNLKYYEVNSREANANIVYSTTQGQTEIKVGSWGEYGWVTGDQIWIMEDTVATTENQPSLVGVWRVTVSGTDYTSAIVIKLDDYTANSNATCSTSGAIKWLNGNDIIKLNTANLTKDIACMEPDRSAWTANGSNATTSLAGTFGGWDSPAVQYFTKSDKISVSSSASTGKVAHFQLPSSLDLSGYQQISFQIRASSGVSQRSETPDSIRLCTDTAGNTSVHTIPIDLRNSHHDTWVAVVKDFGSNLNSSIQSIALYRESTQSSSDYWIQNVIACKDSSDANSITHKSCIGLNDGDNPVWYDVEWIYKDWVKVYAGSTNKLNEWGYYTGKMSHWSQTGDAVNLFKVEPFLIDSVTSTWDDFDEIPFTATFTTRGTYCKIEGGWRDTDMAATGDYATIVRGNGYGVFLEATQDHNYHLKNIGVHNWYYAFQLDGVQRWRLEKIGLSNNNFCFYALGVLREIWGWDFNYVVASKEYGYIDMFQDKDAPVANFNYHLHKGTKNGSPVGIRIGSKHYTSPTINANERPDFVWNKYFSNGDGYHNGPYWDFPDGTVEEYTMKNSTTWAGHSPMGSNGRSWRIKNLTMHNCSYMNLYNGMHCDIDVANITKLAHSTNTSVIAEINGESLSGYGFQCYDGTCYIGDGTVWGEISVYEAGSVIKCESVTHAGPEGPWQSGNGPAANAMLQFKDMDNTSGNNKTYRPAHIFTNDSSIRRGSSGTSLKATVRSTTHDNTGLALGSVLVNGGSAVTVSVWCFAPSGETITLRVKSAPWLGLAEAQEVSFSGSTAANTWTQITKTFTPTAQGKIDIEVDFSQNTANNAMYIDDFGVSQV